MTTAFFSGTDWQQSSGPYTNRYVEKADLWPHGTGGEIDGGNKDVLEAGLHPVLAIGARANRPLNMTGVLVEYEDANRVLMNVAHGMIVRQYVANISGYNQTTGNADAWDSGIDVGDVVYVDDSGPLAAGVTLSRAQTNESGSANPVAGWVFYAQDGYDDTGFGGASAASTAPPFTPSATATEYTLMCVLLTPYSDR